MVRVPHLPEGDTARLRETMANIAGSARQSLRDVRRVLSPGESGTSGAGLGALTSLIDGVRAAGNDVVSSVVGTPRRCRRSSMSSPSGYCRRC